MAKKRSSRGKNRRPENLLPFDQEKEKFMGMVSDVLSKKQFSTTEEANRFLNEAFTGRSMSNLLSEWDTRPDTPLDQARDVIEQIPHDCTVETRRRSAKKALEICRDCMEAWDVLAWTYRSPNKIASTLLEGIAHGRALHADLIAGLDADHGLWGHHEARPFLRLMQGLSELYLDEGFLEEAVGVYEEMISLNPGDNQGVRGRLLHAYIRLKRFGDAERLVARFTDDIDLGIVYGRVLLELVKVLDTVDDIGSLVPLEREGALPPSAFGPEFDGAKSQMREALRLNPFVPLLITHPTSIYVEPPSSYQIGSPEQAMLFIDDFGIEWLCSMVGWLFLSASVGQARTLIKKSRKDLRESYEDLIDYLSGIDEPGWQAALLERMEESH